MLRMTLNKVMFKVTQIEEKIANAKAALAGRQEGTMSEDQQGKTLEEIRMHEKGLDVAKRERKDAFITVFSVCLVLRT